MDAHYLKQIISKYFADKRYTVQLEIGINPTSSLRADVLCMNMRNEIIIVEIKSSVADFKNDKKWFNYLGYSNKFYFAFSEKVYDKVKDIIPKGIGVFVVSTYPVLEKRATSRPLAKEVCLDIATRMAFRASCVQRYKLKSNSSGALLVATTAVEAIQAMNPTDRKGNKQNVIKTVVHAINKFV